MDRTILKFDKYNYFIVIWLVKTFQYKSIPQNSQGELMDKTDYCSDEIQLFAF